MTPAGLVAQDNSPDTAGTKPDTILYTPPVDLTEAEAVTDPVNYENDLRQQPTIALFKSMVIPGWGQAGNGKYVKAVIFLGLQTWFVASAIHYGQDAADFRSKWEAAQTVEERNKWYGLYDDRRDNRNKFTWFAGINAFVAMFDAYVDAHLSGSPEAHHDDNKLSVDFAPEGFDGARVTLSMNF